MIIIGGIFLVRKDGKILLCHPTKHSKNFWSIPKGRLDKGEKAIDAAIRETYEETNVNLENIKVYHELEPVKYDNADKVLHTFVVFETENKFNLDEIEIKCNSNVEPEKGGFPEMDGFKWATTKEAKPLLHIAQGLALEQLVKMIQKTK